MSPETIMAIAEHNRERNTLIRSRNRIQSTLLSHVGSALGYSPTLPDAERAAKIREATAMIKGIVSSKLDSKQANSMRMFVEDMWRSVASLNMCIAVRTKAMTKMAETLPVADWIQEPEQNGAGLLTLAQIIGECGDLSNYPSPAHLWSRMGAAPYCSCGVMQMGSTWRRAGKGSPKLSADEWTEYGQCKRRATLTHIIGENLMKQNFIRSKTKTGKARKKAGPYRARFDEAKKASKKSIFHADWSDCRHNNHAILLAGKRFLLELWKQWNPTLVRNPE